MSRYWPVSFVGVLAAACGSNATAPTPPSEANCAAPLALSLAVGQHQVVNPTGSAGCVRLGGTTADEEYFVAVLAGTGLETPTGVTGPVTARFGPAGTVSVGNAAVNAAPFAAAGQTPVGSWPAEFDRSIRAREAALPISPIDRRQAAFAAPAAAPAVGEFRTFKTCKTPACTTFDDAVGVARTVGTRVVIWTDTTNIKFPDTLTTADYQSLAGVFENDLIQIAEEAFGGESDIDGDGLIHVLMTRRVNDFTANCSQGLVIGYFFGGDLLTTFPNSNKAEIFFTYAPAPAKAGCNAITRSIALNQVKPTLIHEFQHMISFNQHRLIRSGPSELTWLNEALSHLAEDLAAQLVPNASCPGVSSCRSLFGTPNLLNAFDYLKATDQTALVFAGNSSGSLAERGSGFLFLRWLLDQFGSGTNGFALTRALLDTELIGEANLQAAAGQPFDNLVGEWQLANYTDDLPGFAVPLRLSYPSWNFRSVMNNPANSQIFPGGFPLQPIVAATSLTRTGPLHAGTGRPFLVRPGGDQFDLLVSGNVSSSLQPDPALKVRLAVVRIK